MHGIRHAGRGNGHDHEGTDGLHDSPLEEGGFEPSVPLRVDKMNWASAGTHTYPTASGAGGRA